jgi:hypothetical protein
VAVSDNSEPRKQDKARSTGGRPSGRPFHCEDVLTPCQPAPVPAGGRLAVLGILQPAPFKIGPGVYLPSHK